jgi:Tfp pilus assembly protein PilV
LNFDVNEEGFSMVEVIASLVIISLISITLLGILYHSFLVSDHADDKIVLMNLAKLVLKNYQNKPFDAVAGEKGAWKTLNPKDFIVNGHLLSFDPSRYEAKVLITDPSDVQLNGYLLNIEVTVQKKGKENQKVQLTGYIKKGG